MNIAVLLSFVALAINFASSRGVSRDLWELEGLSSPSDSFLDILGSQVFHIIRNRGDQNHDSRDEMTRDTIDFETQHVDLCGPIMCISANLTKGSLTGVNGYDVLNLDFNTDGERIIIDIDMIFPSLQLDAEYYEMEGSILNALPLAGEGHLHFEATDFRFWTKIITSTLQMSDKTSIESFENSGFSINSISSRTEFDGNIDDIFNAMVGELLAERLNRFNKAIAAQLGDVLKETINPLL